MFIHVDPLTNQDFSPTPTRPCVRNSADIDVACGAPRGLRCAPASNRRMARSQSLSLPEYVDEPYTSAHNCQ